MVSLYLYFLSFILFLGLPDYPQIITRPMDLRTIKEKLQAGQYTDPWGFIDDMWLMFENAWTYNRKNTRVYKMSTNLSKEFLKHCEPVMKKAGFCCAKKLTFTPLPLCCYGKTTCTINVGAYYHVYKNQGNNFGVETNDKIYYWNESKTFTMTFELTRDRNFLSI